MLISLIVAMARNRVIGSGGQIPWHLPEELQHFKRLTMGHTLLMGRTTFESIGRPLPGRTTCLLSRSLREAPPGCQLFSELSAALAAVAAGDESELFVCGGAELYRAALPGCDRIYLSELEFEAQGDRYFPEIPAEQFTTLRRVRFCGEQSWTFSILQRLRSG